MKLICPPVFHLFLPILKTSGYTLIDLLIVMAIVSISCGLGLPSLQALLEESRAEMYMKTLSRDIMYMRTYAITQGHSVTLCPLEGGKCNADWSKNISIFSDYNMDRELGGDDRLLKLINDPNESDIFTYPRIGITYRSDGSLNGFQTGTFRYCPVVKDSIFSKGLVISQAGRSRFRDKKVKCK